ncbi:VQ domain-containing protein [Heracleum sosnowskyi]|uniref:VQ domain-containing protein n=1 Tax=Heracleum sosnowskyi TaxID=360622 RepID=A0AAD8JKH8_9APIA|nr:VQ domain-containing protein [Heracleum sosnowskyi]
MSDTMSSPTDNWAQYYQHNAPAKPAGLFISNQVSDATTVSTNTISSASGGGLSPEGRVSKPVRKRSRASRRTPTTLLNTDTANFRAMVQQFTGGSLASFPSTGPTSTSSYPIGTNFSLGIGTGQQYANPNAVMVPRPGYNISQVQQQLQQQQHQFLFSKNDDHHAYLRGIERSTLPQMDASGVDGFRMDGVSSSVPPIIRSSSSSQNLSEDNYML